MTFKKIVWCCALAFLPGSWVYASMEDDPVVYLLDVEELEWREASDGNVISWDMQAWVGKDRDKLLLKSEGERNSYSTEEFELQAFYNRSISPFWDLQLGWRHDWQPVIQRDWLAAGIAGTLPGLIETEITFYYGESGRTAVRLKFDYHILLTQRLSLTPALEMNIYGDDDIANGVASGLATTEIGMRLHYAVRPALKPYVGLNWHKLSGTTADLAEAEAEGESDGDVQVLAGLTWWF